MIHAEFKLYDRFSRVLIDIPSLCPNEELTEMVMAHAGTMVDAINLLNTLKLKKDTFPKIERYSDGFQLTAEVERRPQGFEGLDEYKDLVEADLIELHDIFRDLVRETEALYPAIFLRHG